MSERRSLVVTSTFPQFEGDVRGAFLRHYWSHALKEGERIEVLAPRTRWSRGELDCELRVHRFPYAPDFASSLTGRFGILENLRERPWRAALVPAFFWGLGRAIERQLRAAAFDRVVAHFWLPSGIAVSRHCAGRIPFEVYGHGTDVDLVLRLPGPLRRWVAGQLARAERIYLPSSAKRERVIAELGWQDIADRVRVECMGHAISVQLSDSPAVVEGRYFLFLGRLIQQKGVDLLLRAAAAVPGARVVIAGDGPQREQLEALARKLGVDAQFVGWVQGEVKSALLRDADAVVVPSRDVGGLSEGAPLVIAEAHALGRPIVATDVGGIVELGGNLGADLRPVPPEGVESLAHELRAILAAPIADRQSLESAVDVA